jgi:hypothetical protein
MYRRYQCMVSLIFKFHISDVLTDTRDHWQVWFRLMSLSEKKNSMWRRHRYQRRTSKLLTVYAGRLWPLINWSIDYLLFYVLLKNISLIWRRHHCRWRAAKFRPMLGAHGLWAGRDLYRATPTVTRGLGFSGLIRRTAPFSRLLRHVWGCGGPILTRIFMGFYGLWLGKGFSSRNTCSDTEPLICRVSPFN